VRDRVTPRASATRAGGFSAPQVGFGRGARQSVAGGVGKRIDESR
jgi:hypothetical protein